MKKLKIALMNIFGFIFFINPLFCSEPARELRLYNFCQYPCGATSMSYPSTENPFRGHRCADKECNQYSATAGTINIESDGKNLTCPLCNQKLPMVWVARHLKDSHQEEMSAVRTLTTLSKQKPE